MAVNNNLYLKRITVGAKADFRTLKEAVDWFNANATSNMEILLGAGHHLVTDTITVNNSSYSLQIRGLGSKVTFIDASTGLTGKPMFIFKTPCDVNKVTANGATLTNYGIVTGENFINYDTLNLMYSEVTDIIINKFDIGLYDTVGTSIFAFNFVLSNINTAGYRVNTSNDGSFIDAEIGSLENCAIGADLLQANKGSFLFDGIYIEQNSAGQIGLKYSPATYALNGHTKEIINCASNYVGITTQGFDFSRSDGRDSNVFVSNNMNISNQYPTAKINLIGNSTSTTIATPGTFVKANFVNTSSFTIKYTIANNRITWQPVATRNIAIHVSASVIASSANANISMAIVKNGNTGLGLFGKMPTFCKNASEAYSSSTVVYLPDIMKDDYFELWVTADAGNVIVQDANILALTI